MPRSIVVIAGGVSVPSSTRLLADQISSAVETQVGSRGEAAAVSVIELRELAQDLAAMTTGGVASLALKRARDLVSSADAVNAVTPTFSGSYSGLFKMFVDVLDTDALNGMPVLVAATAGSPRHALMLDHAMRPLFTYLRAVVVPTGVFAATEDFAGRSSGQGSAVGSGRTGSVGDSDDGLSRRVTRAAAELATLVVGAGAVAGFGPDHGPARPRRSGNDLDAQVTPFEVLLRGHDG